MPVACDPPALTLPETSGLSKHGGSRARIDLQLAQKLATPAAIGDVEHQGAGSVAHLGRERAGEPVADVVLGQEDLAHPVPVLRLMLANPEQLGCGEPRERRVGHHPDQGLAAAGTLLDLAALSRGSLIVPEQGRANDRAGLVEEDRAVHLPGEADPGDVGRLELALGQHGLDRLLRRVPPEPGILLGPARVGVGAGILGRRRTEDRPLLVDGQGLGSRGADIDPQCDAHVVISQRSPHRKTRGSTPGGSRRASASNVSTGTVLNVNIS